MTLALEALGSDQTLDLGGLGVFLLSLTIGGNGTADHEFPVLSNNPRLSIPSHTKTAILCIYALYRVPDIILLVQAEELADLGGALGSESLGVDDVCEAGEFAFALSDDAESQDSEIEAGDGCVFRLDILSIP